MTSQKSSYPTNFNLFKILYIISFTIVALSLLFIIFFHQSFILSDDSHSVITTPSLTSDTTTPSLLTTSSSNPSSSLLSPSPNVNDSTLNHKIRRKNKKKKKKFKFGKLPERYNPEIGGIAKYKVQNAKTLLLGRREMIHFPQFGIANLLGKVDSGARTSCLDVANVKSNAKTHTISFDVILDRNDRSIVQSIHDFPWRNTTKRVTSSNGHTSERYVIKTLVTIGEEFRNQLVEFTLVDRQKLACPVLIGRNIIRHGSFLVDCNRKFVAGKKRKSTAEQPVPFEYQYHLDEDFIESKSLSTRTTKTFLRKRKDSILDEEDNEEEKSIVGNDTFRNCVNVQCDVLCSNSTKLFSSSTLNNCCCCKLHN
ncbi:hypothetical protein ABK040_009371 [Willaertia magna]